MKKIIVLALIIISVFAVYGVAKCSKKETTEPKTDVATYQPVEKETIAETTTEETTDDSIMVEKDTQYNLEDLSFIIPAKWKYSESDTISEQYVHITSTNGAFISVSKVNGDIEEAKEKETEEINNLKETGADTVNYVFLKESINGYNIESGTAFVISDPAFLKFDTYLFPYNDNTTYVIKFWETNISNGVKEDIELYKNYYLNKVTLNQNTTVFQNSMPTEKSTEKPTEKPAQLLFQNNGIKITYTGITYSYGRTEINVRIENNSGKDYIVQTRNESVNGYMISPVFSCKVTNGKIANDKITFFNSDLEKNEIKRIENVELSFHVFNDEDFKDRFDTEKISFNP